MSTNAAVFVASLARLFVACPSARADHLICHTERPPAVSIKKLYQGTETGRCSSSTMLTRQMLLSCRLCDKVNEAALGD